MKRLGVVILIAVMWSCSDNASNADFTGNQLNYTLFQGSEFDYEGVVVISEKQDGSAQIRIELEGPEGERSFPAHLHFGSFDTPDAELAAVLSPVSAKSGISLTDLDFLSNDTRITFEALESFDGHIKVHLDDGANQNVILAFGNIGSNKLMLDGEVAQCEGPN